MTFDPTPFPLGEAVKNWGLVVGVIGLIVGGVTLLTSILTMGFTRGPSVYFSSLRASLNEFVTIAPRRVYALASLTVREAVRRKALMVFVVFAILFMFAGWFLADANTRERLQIKVYVSFVLTAINWLVIPVVLLLSCWSIPEDIRLRSLHTVVTKPARRIEIVLGRMLGFITVGAIVLGIMSVVGYVWIGRQIDDKQNLVCRVPVHGKLIFLDREGRPETSGVNVGDVWGFRSYIEGETRARAIWNFHGLTSRRVGETLRLESRFEAFRTHKGRDMREGILCQFTLVNDRREDAFIFLATSPTLNQAAEFLRQGQFLNAADELDAVAESFRTGETEVTAGGVAIIGAVLDLSSRAINLFEDRDAGDWRADLAPAMQEASQTANRTAAGIRAAADSDLTDLADALSAIAAVFRTHASHLRETLVVVRVPRPQFEVVEYRGENVFDIPRKLKYEGTEQDIARKLSQTITALDSDGKLVRNGTINEAAILELADQGELTEELAETVANVLGELVDDGTISLAEGALDVTDGRSRFELFEELVRADRLLTPDVWQLQADLFDDLTVKGRLRVEVACNSIQQYLGMARPDLFVRLKNRTFAVGYFKAILGIGLMMCVVVAIGVASSCLVKGPVATLLTFSVVLIGQVFHDFMERLVAGEIHGGSVAGTVFRMHTHLNPSAALDTTAPVKTLITATDWGFENLLRLVSTIMPNFNYYTSTAIYVENGFDIPWNASLLPCIVAAVGFIVPCILAGYLTLKFRELEAK